MKKPINRRRVKRKRIFIFLIVFFIILAVFFLSLKYFDRDSFFVSPLSQENLSFSNNSSLSELEKLLKEKEIEYEKTSYTKDSHYLIVLKDGEEVILSYKKDLSGQIDSLQLIMSRLTIEGKMFKRLDLRFDKPLLVFR